MRACQLSFWRSLRLNNCWLPTKLKIYDCNSELRQIDIFIVHDGGYPAQFRSTFE
jgi:hypothetical protein